MSNHLNQPSVKNTMRPTAEILRNRVNYWTSFSILALIVTIAFPAYTNPVAVTVKVDNESPAADLAPRFLGLSYESSMLLPKDGRYYFNSHDQALINAFHTLGIKSLRVGANAVDDPKIPVPQTQDIDHLFDFARAAGLKVIYSFRLKNGDPANSARLAAYIAANDSDVLDSFSIGNEPSFFLHSFRAYYAEWRPHYDAILKAVPTAMFDGPGVAAQHDYVVNLARLLFPDGHLAMASNHYYFLGSGRAGELDPPSTRERFLAAGLHRAYEKAYADTGAKLAAMGVPYRIDELNSCYNGGAKNASDTFASTLWALDCTHWWAAHHILGMNYHTGESVGRDGGFGAANYAAFVHRADGNGFDMRPQAYAYLAFTQGAHGRPIGVEVQTEPGLGFEAYAYQDRDNTIYLTVINKSHGSGALPDFVTVQLPQTSGAGTWEQMDLMQGEQDIAAKINITLGGSSIDPQGIWRGNWRLVGSVSSQASTFEVDRASASILRFTPAK
jgi:hypothetical protein